MHRRSRFLKISEGFVETYASQKSPHDAGFFVGLIWDNRRPIITWVCAPWAKWLREEQGILPEPLDGINSHNPPPSQLNKLFNLPSIAVMMLPKSSLLSWKLLLTTSMMSSSPFVYVLIHAS